MLKGFEIQTEPLNEYEKNTLMPIVARGLAFKVGKENAVTSKHICECLTAKGYEIDDVRLRKIVNYIRVKGVVKCVLACGRGYYVAKNRKQAQEYTDSLKCREDSIHAVRVALTDQIACAFYD